ncbi:hypothetical protein A3B60_03000 [Candidatus Peregrinibacteria bacterium RIFCSPLOWO2_01_FULL_39_12]|nr:MAG: hypothetical protein A3B60_03000 [Candidatus Peregrinibacteria bacterium RIFCSPLOWO2_01_FULL_39_12]OGJ43723.1 MAG: hypothetical protein A3I58_01710 [Candidatus Peregrinibacteria bacterium RIFCSPLOWO2_02_FULL_39_10]
MFLHTNPQFEIFKPKRLIFENSPDKPTNNPENSSPEVFHEKTKDQRNKLGDDVSNKLVLPEEKLNKLDLVKLDVDSLIKLEDKYPGILLYIFTDITGDNEKIDFSKWEFYKKPVAGQKLKVDFRENNAANMEIGAADMLSPVVRCITVYEDGDSALARTSERRLGLKGKNRSNGIGFFDKNGYIPIYTGDTMIIGGAAESKKNIDLNYDKPFLTKKADGTEILDDESYARYEQSDEARKDREYLDKLYKENPQASRSKNLTHEEIDAIEARNTSTGIGANIVKTALMVARNGGMGMRGKHCWDWSNKIYKMAGVSGNSPTKTIFTYTKKYPGKDCKPYDAHATPSQYAQISPGDWIFYNNRNTSDAHGNHSAVFLEWIDRDNLLARVASGSFGKPWHVHNKPIDFKDKPVTRLGKPSGSIAVLPDITAIEQKYRHDKIPPVAA